MAANPIHERQLYQYCILLGPPLNDHHTGKSRTRRAQQCARYCPSAGHVEGLVVIYSQDVDGERMEGMH